MKRAVFLLVFFMLISCKNESAKQITEPSDVNEITLTYAKGFSVKHFKTHKILTINNAWPGTSKSFKYVLVDKQQASQITFNKNEFEAIIITPIQKIVVTSTTHIPALELLGAEERLIGFPGIDYVSSEKTRKRIDSGLVRELGKNESINTEVLLELNPDVVIGFSVNGTNKTFETIKKSNIPVIYNGDWVENSPLAKAEWIKFFGVLFNKQTQADSIFNNIEKNYNEAKLLAKEIKTLPTILSGAMHNDIWYLPNGSSTEAQLLKDANTNYLWNDSKGSGSLSLNFETVFSKAKNADIWLSPSNYSSLEALEKSNSHNTMFKAFKNKNVYSVNNTTGKTGGVLYFEFGMARPDLVLKDIIKICHPELLKNYDPNFFKRLD